MKNRFRVSTKTLLYCSTHPYTTRYAPSFSPYDLSFQALMQMRKQTRTRRVALPGRTVEESLTEDQLEVVRLFEYGWYKHVSLSKGRKAAPRNSWLG